MTAIVLIIIIIFIVLLKNIYIADTENDYKLNRDNCNHFFFYQRTIEKCDMYLNARAV